MPDERRALVAERPEVVAHPDQRLAALANRQYGVVARRQLAALGVTGAMVKSRLASGRLERALARTAGRHGPGHHATREALAELGAIGTTLTHSELEDRFLSLLVAHDLPRPQMNATIAGMQVDVVWDAHRVAVELDGYAYHHTRKAFQQDRDRANDLTLAGYTALRFTHADVVRPPHRVAGRLARRLR